MSYLDVKFTRYACATAAETGCPERVETASPNYLAMPDWCQTHGVKIDVPVEARR